MVSVTLNLYNNYIPHVQRGNFDLEDDTIKLAGLKSTYTPVLTEQYWSEISSHEISGTGYTAGGKALANKVVTSSFDADDVVWTPVTATDWRYLVMYKDTGVASTSLLMWYYDLGSSFNPTAGTATFAVGQALYQIA